MVVTSNLEVIVTVLIRSDTFGRMIPTSCRRVLPAPAGQVRRPLYRHPTNLELCASIRSGFRGLECNKNTGRQGVRHTNTQVQGTPRLGT